ncbi:MAG: alpha-mannosidase [Armatimonadota bacterium]
MGKDRVLHMIGNAHLDPVWLWRWSEGFEAARATFQSALDRMDEEPEFIFTSSQAAVYQWIERGDPELFAKIKARVQEGRWKICGGWWMQPDCNIPSGESFVRQGLYAQRFFMEKLGTMATVGYNVDSFGHNRMIPQIIKKCGMDSYVFMRPNSIENPDVPGTIFWWESPDGTRVLTYRIPGAYCNFGDWMEREIHETAAMTDQYPQLMRFYGVGNHGGGPTKDNLERIARLQKDESLPELRYSSPDIFFDTIRADGADYPVWTDDLQHHASGCYAAHSGIKQDNRAIEHLLASAEILSVMASQCAGLAYPKDDLTRAWEGLLFNQFHDILAGTSIHEAYHDARNLHGMSYQFATETVTFASGALVAKLDTIGDGEPLVVFNTLSWDVDDYCECEIHGIGGKVRMQDNDGNPIPCQVVNPSAAMEPGWRSRVVFPAKVPSAGYKLYRAFPEEDTSETKLKVGPTFLENDLLRVEIDPGTGQPSSIFDKRNGIEMLSAPSAAKVIDDPSDTWSHNVFSFPNVIGQFEGTDLHVTEEGPVRAVVQSTSRYGNSSLVQEFRLYANSDYLECVSHIDWHEQLKLLKLAFPTSVQNPVATYEIPYGHINRPANGEEEPGLTWVDVSNDKYGFTLVNDSKYSYDITDGTINLTAIRSPIYAFHIPSEINPNRRYTYIDQGYSRFKYRIAPHTGAWQEAYPHKKGLVLNTPLLGVVVSYHEGEAPAESSFVTASAENVIVSAVKQAEDGNGIIVRSFETNGQPVDCTFNIAGFSWRSGFGPCEIKTFLVTESGVCETDMLERVLE